LLHRICFSVFASQRNQSKINFKIFQKSYFADMDAL